MLGKQIAQALLSRSRISHRGDSMENSTYLRARQEWDERYADLVLGKRNWQIAAAGSIAVSLILAAGIVWLSTRSRFVPYVVQVDKLGYALAAPQALSADSSNQLTDERILRYELAGFIRSARDAVPGVESVAECAVALAGFEQTVVGDIERVRHRRVGQRVG